MVLGVTGSRKMGRGMRMESLPLRKQIDVGLVFNEDGCDFCVSFVRGPHQWSDLVFVQRKVDVRPVAIV